MELHHPGEILKIEVIEGRGLTIGKAAELLAITRPTLSNILNGKAAITPNIALRIETVLAERRGFGFGCNHPTNYLSLKRTF